jgi:hypothetical protein
MAHDQFIIGSDGYPHIDKDPNAQINYTWDWTSWLTRSGSTSISTTSVTPDTGITVVGSPAISSGLVTAVVSGGTLNGSYKLVCRINTNDGLIDERTIVVDVKEL